jgi:transposase
VRVLDAVDRGVPRREVANLFGVSLSTIKRYVKRRRPGEDLAPRPSTGRKRRILATSEEKRTLSVGAARKERRGHPRAPLRAVGAKGGCEGIFLATMSRAIRNKLD